MGRINHGIAVFFFLVLAALTTQTAERKLTNAAPATSTNVIPILKQRPYVGIVKIVNSPARQIVLEGKKSQTFNILEQTKITKNTNSARLETIVVGDKVSGLARERPGGGWDALSVKAVTQQGSFRK